MGVCKVNTVEDNTVEGISVVINTVEGSTADGCTPHLLKDRSKPFNMIIKLQSKAIRFIYSGMKLISIFNQSCKISILRAEYL